MIHNMYLVKRRAYIRGYARYLERYGQLRAREVALAEQLRKWATAPLTCIITDPSVFSPHVFPFANPQFSVENRRPKVMRVMKYSKFFSVFFYLHAT